MDKRKRADKYKLVVTLAYYTAIFWLMSEYEVLKINGY